MTDKLVQLREQAVQAKPDIQEYLNCGYINHLNIAPELEASLDVSVERVTGGIWQSRAKREEHAFLRVTDVGDSVPEPVIVDGSINQFCERNRDELWVVLGPREELPEVAVLTGDESNDWYSMFCDRRP